MRQRRIAECTTTITVDGTEITMRWMQIALITMTMTGLVAADPPPAKTPDQLAQALSELGKQLEEKNALILKQGTTNAELASSLAATTPGKKIEQYVAWCNEIRSTAATNEQKLQEHIAKLTTMLIEQQAKLDAARQEIERLTAELTGARAEKPK